MRRCRLLVGAALLCSAAWAVTDTPTDKGFADLSSDELTRQLDQFRKSLPTVRHKVTDNFIASGEKACGFFKAVYPKRDKLAEGHRLQLGLVGLHAGYTAGDAETMQKGANLLLATVTAMPAGKKRDALADYAWYGLAWASLFKGEAAVAEKALKYMVAHAKSDPTWGKWAAGMLTGSKQFGRQVHLTIGVIDGKRVTTAGLRGKAVLLEFGAGKAEPWVKGLMALKMFHHARKDDARFALIGVCMDGSAEAAKATAKKYEIPWPLVPSMELRKQFLGRGLPHAVVLSPAGHVIWQGHPGVLGNLSRAVDFARRQAGHMAKTAPATAPSAAVDESEVQARQKYRLAMTYRDAGFAAKAKAVLAEIVRKFPKTRAAADARKALAEQAKP